MTHIITSLCVRDRGCIEVCPVECMVPGEPVAKWPWIYMTPYLFDCGVLASRNAHTLAIFPEESPGSLHCKGR